MLWASEARQRSEWDRFALLMARIQKHVGGKWVDPDKLNPFRRRLLTPRKKGPPDECENKAGWAALNEAMRAMAKRK